MLITHSLTNPISHSEHLDLMSPKLHIAQHTDGETIIVRKYST